MTTDSTTGTDVLSERARIEEIVAGRTLIDSLAATATARADEPAYSDRHGTDDGWRTLTWAETRDRALDVAAALVERGVKVGDHVAIMATNRIEHFLADMGAVHAAATPMSIYNTLSPEQVAYVARDVGARIAVLGGADQVARWGRALDEGYTKHVVVLDADALPDGDDRFLGWDDLLAAGAERRTTHPDELEQRHSALDPDAPATNDRLTATVLGSDADGDALTFTYTWTVDGVVRRTTTTSATSDGLDLSVAGNGDVGDVISVTVVASDGTLTSAAATANAIVANTPPAVSVMLDTAAPGKRDVLVATTTAADADADVLTYTYVWRLDGTVVRTETTSAATSALDLRQVSTKFGDVVTVTVTASDGTASADASASATVTVPKH